MVGCLDGWVGVCKSICWVDRWVDGLMDNSINQMRNSSNYLVCQGLQVYLMAVGRMDGWVAGWLGGWVDI